MSGRREDTVRKPPPGSCTSCGVLRGVDPERGQCADCLRRGTVRGECWSPGVLSQEPVDPIGAVVLGIEVVKQAQADVATHVAKHPERHHETHAQVCYAADARDFLLTRLWEPGNLWGELVTPALHQGHRYEFRQFCDGLKVRKASQGQRLKRAKSTLVATAVEDDEHESD